MKYFFIPALLCLCAQVIFAQDSTSTITVTQETGVFEKQRFIDRYDYVFMTKHPTKWMLRTNMAGLLNEGVNPNLELEVKVLKNFSIKAGATRHFVPLAEPGSHSQSFTSTLETRWYYDMARRIRNGQSAANVSGNYLSLRGEYQAYDKYHPENYQAYRNYDKNIQLRYGLQRRLSRFAYIDIGTGIGVRQHGVTLPYGSFKPEVYLNSSISLGFDLAGPTIKKGAHFEMCDVLSCFRETNHLLKINLFNVIKLDGIDHISANVQVALEHKLWHSPFSVEGLLYVQPEYARVKLSDNRDLQRNKYDEALINLQLRYYYLQKRRIAKGKSGNNLNGAYVAMGAGLNHSYEKSETLVWNSSSDVDEYTVYLEKHWQMRGELMLGWQYNIFQNGYIDFQIGYASSKDLTEYDPSYHVWLTDIRGRFAAGLAF